MAESEYDPVSDYEGAVSDYEREPPSEFDDSEEWDTNKSLSKRSARVSDGTLKRGSHHDVDVSFADYRP